MQALEAKLSCPHANVVEDLAFDYALKGCPPEERIQLEEVFHDISDLLSDRRQLLCHHISSFFDWRYLFHPMHARSIQRLLELPNIIDRMLARQKAQVLLALHAEVLQDD